MDSSVLGAVFLSASLQVLFDRLVPSREFIRLASRQFINYFRGRKHDEVQPPLDVAESTNTAVDDCVIEFEDARSMLDSEFPTSSSTTAQTFGHLEKLNQITMYSMDRVECTVGPFGFYIEPHRPNRPTSISIGPFGGFGGHHWNDGSTYTTIRQIMISHGVVIDSIQIEYDLNGQSIWSDKRGESVGSKRAVVKLDYPREFLINISGYFSEYNTGGPIVRSLTIESNKQKYGPFGTEHGKHFSTASTGGKITGFYGRCGLYLDSIAAYFEAYEFLSIGPFGGLGGNQWNDGTYTGIREIYIHHGDVIEAIQMDYDKDGQSIISDLHGIPTGGHLVEVKLDYPNEYLVSISGYCTKDASTTVIQSLIIQSNIKQYGPYGRKEGKYFSTSLTGGKIVGFYGRCDLYLDSIGAYYVPF